MTTKVKEYICIKKCFYNGRIYKPGETLAPSKDDKLTKEFFVEKGKEKLPKSKKEEVEANTFSEMVKKEAEETLKGVGHGVKPDSILD